MRAIIVAAAVVLLTLAGCEEMTEKPEPAPEPSTPAPELPPESSPEPDTAPSFAGTVANQSYTEGEAITPLTLPSASGGEGSLTYSMRPVPPELVFDAITRVLSGTPTAAGTYDVEYRVEDTDANTAATDAASLTFTITVQEPELDTAPSFTGTVADQSYTVGEAITPLTLPSASGDEGPLTYSLHPTPPAPGLMFDPATRVLSGTPTTAGTYAVDYRVEDGDANTAASASLSFTITVAPVPACPAHSATRIVGDWDASGAHAMDDEVYSFRADGTFQINYGAVKINNESEGSYSYDATTCTLAWRGTEPAAEPSIEFVRARSSLGKGESVK